MDRTSIHGLFEAQVQRTPQATALVLDDAALTYGELNRRANQVAHRLRALGVKPEAPIGISMERSLEIVVGILGILKAGGAYVPLDPVYPPDRLGFMLADSRAQVLLTQERLLDGLPEHGAQIICLDQHGQSLAAENEENPTATVEPNNLAYVIYTSGSTGRPKGVCVTHQAAAAHFTTMQSLWELDPRDRVLQFASFSFDASLEQTFPALSSGATVVLRGPVGWSPAEFSQRVRDLGLTVVDLPTAYWDQWVQGCVAECDQTLHDSLRLVIVGGDTMQAESVRRWQRTPLHAIRLVNAYGPTEATITASVFEITPHLRYGVALDNIPIGRPLPNRMMHILDMNGAPVPVGAAGELHIGGAGLARGYLNRPDLTAATFIHDPFSHVPDARLYKTGDRACYLPDGDIAFLGRIDHQVKIRGFRIELGEIEARLSRHPAVRETVVVAREEAPGDKRLVAYVVPRHEPATSSELRRFLQEELPDYMMPSTFVFLEALPLTPNGKIDRAALPPPDSARPDVKSAYEAPRTRVEEVLAGIWAQSLRIDCVGIHDNFLELGGDSLLAMHVMSRAAQAGLRFSSEHLFRFPTIAQLAAVARGTTAAIQAEQGLVTGPVPLTPALHYFFTESQRHCHDGIECVSCEVRQAVDVALLERAVRVVLTHHDALRLRFFRDEGGWRAFCAREEENHVSCIMNLSRLSEEAQQTAIETTLAELEDSISLTKGPLIRVAYFDLGVARPGRLEILIHHLVFDAYSEAILLQDLEAAYLQLHRRLVEAGAYGNASTGVGHAPLLPPKTTSFKYWAERLTAYAQSAELRQEMKDWPAMSWDQAARLPLDYPIASDTVGHVRSVKVALSPGETRTLLYGVTQATGAKFNDVLLTALSQAVSTWTASRAVLLSVASHGREPIFDDVDLSRTVGWFTCAYPVLLEVAETHRAGDTLQAVKEQVRRVPARGLGYDIVRYLGGDRAAVERLRRLPRPEIDVNYLGQLDQLHAGLSVFVPRVEAHDSTVLRRRQRSKPAVPTFSGLRLKGHVQGGQLHLGLQYHENAYRRKTMKRIVQGVVEELRVLIADCCLREENGSDHGFVR